MSVEAVSSPPGEAAKVIVGRMESGREVAALVAEAPSGALRPFGASPHGVERKTPRAKVLVGQAMTLVVRGLILAYQLVPAYFFRGSCRFEPGCSRYASEAVAVHGAVRGSWLAVRRICRCHPWGGLGYDPVPPPAGASAVRRAGPSAGPHAGPSILGREGPPRTPRPLEF